MELQANYLVFTFNTELFDTVIAGDRAYQLERPGVEPSVLIYCTSKICNNLQQLI